MQPWPGEKLGKIKKKFSLNSYKIKKNSRRKIKIFSYVIIWGEKIDGLGYEMVLVNGQGWTCGVHTQKRNSLAFFSKTPLLIFF